MSSSVDPFFTEQVILLISDRIYVWVWVTDIAMSQVQVILKNGIFMETTIFFFAEK